MCVGRDRGGGSRNGTYEMGRAARSGEWPQKLPAAGAAAAAFKCVERGARVHWARLCTGPPASGGQQQHGVFGVCFMSRLKGTGLTPSEEGGLLCRFWKGGQQEAAVSVEPAAASSVHIRSRSSQPPPTLSHSPFSSCAPFQLPASTTPRSVSASLSPRPSTAATDACLARSLSCREGGGQGREGAGQRERAACENLRRALRGSSNRSTLCCSIQPSKRPPGGSPWSSRRRTGPPPPRARPTPAPCRSAPPPRTTAGC